MTSAEVRAKDGANGRKIGQRKRPQGKGHGRIHRLDERQRQNKA